MLTAIITVSLWLTYPYFVIFLKDVPGSYSVFIYCVTVLWILDFYIRVRAPNSFIIIFLFYFLRISDFDCTQRGTHIPNNHIGNSASQSWFGELFLGLVRCGSLRNPGEIRSAKGSRWNVVLFTDQQVVQGAHDRLLVSR